MLISTNTFCSSQLSGHFFHSFKKQPKKNGKCLIKNICSKSHAFPKHFGSKLGCFKLVRSAHQPSLNSAMRRGVRVDGGGRLEDGEGAGLMDRN